VRISRLAAASLTAVNFFVEIQGPKKTGFLGSDKHYRKCCSFMAREK
jgi:hypothetical protein